MNNKKIIFDTETTGLSIFKGAEPFLLGTKELNGASTKLDYDMDEELNYELEDETIDKIAHNAKFDILMLKTKDILIKGKLWDTMLMAHLIEGHKSSSLLNVTSRWTPEFVKKEDLIEEWFKMQGIKKEDRRYDLLPKYLIEPYLVGDLDSTEAVFNKLMPIIQERKLLPLLEQECKLIYVLVDMYTNGVKIDIDYLSELAEKTIVEMEKLQLLIYETAGVEFDILSARQLSKILIRAGANLPLTDKGNYSCSEDSLKTVNHPLVKQILDYRHMSKMFSTYIMGLLKEQIDDVIHCDLLQHGTVTGRFSSREPNLQNIPRDNKDIRRAFIPRNKDFNLFFVDYKQMEYRVFLDYIKEEELIRQINEEDADFHTMVAAILKPYLKCELIRVYKEDNISVIEYRFNGNLAKTQVEDFEGNDEELLELVFDKDCRTIAKTFNFAMIYGAGIAKIADMLNISYDLAKQLKEIYFRNLPNVKPFLKSVENNIYLRSLEGTVEGMGYIRNKYGRQYWLTPREAYKAVNYLVQGTCADMVKDAMIKVHELLKPYKSNLLLQIHDELILEIHKDEHFLVPKIKEIMEDFSHMFKVKIGVDVSWSKDNWANKEDYVIV